MKTNLNQLRCKDLEAENKTRDFVWVKEKSLRSETKHSNEVYFIGPAAEENSVCFELFV